MSVTPVNDRILVLPQKPETVTSGGFVIPESAQEKLPRGKIISVGKGRRLDDGTYATPEVQVDDVILYAQGAAQTVKLKGVDYVVIKEEDILCIVND